MKNRTSNLFFTTLCLILLNITTAYSEDSSCYQQLELETPVGNINKALYIFVDQTTPLSATMRANLNKLLSEHPQRGELVRIARFAPNVKGQYIELLYEGVRDSKPSEPYLYHLRDEDNAALLACLDKQDKSLQQSFNSALQQSLGMINTKLPKTELLYGLKRLSESVLINNEVDNKTVLIISDGMENSEVISFYGRRSIDKRKIATAMEMVNQKNLLADWRGAQIYMFGLGNIQDERKHIQPSQLEPLLHFWQQYFAAGGAIIKELGTPAILSSNL